VETKTEDDEEMTRKLAELMSRMVVVTGQERKEIAEVNAYRK
jgi:hypothetical protein